MENMSLIQMFTIMINPPPAEPCIARPTIIIFIFMDNAQTMEDMMNSTMAPRRIGLRPQISLSFAQIGAPAAFAMR